VSGELVRYEPTSSGVQVRPAFNLNLSGFNIFGNLGKVLGEVILYRIEAKRSQAQLRELQSRVKVAEHIIDAHTRSQMAEIALRARALDGALSVAAAELAQRAKAIDALIDMLESASAHLRELGTDPRARADRRNAMQLQREMAKLLTELALAPAQSNGVSAIQHLVARPSQDLMVELRHALSS
jgi:hypothetical protein